MWFVDVAVDLPWLVEKRGKLGEPKSRSRQPIPDADIQNEFLLYGDEHAIRHLRIMLHTDSDEPPHDIVNGNIHRWVNLLEVASGLAAPRIATTASLGMNTSAMMVWLSQGDETTASLQIDPHQYAPACEVDYQAAAKLMAAWKPDFRVHLFYLGRFLNHELPPEVRWLNGYRLLEWHFRRGKVGLAKDKTYLAFLARHGQALDVFLGPKQDRKGVIEEVRALAAHAILSRTADPRNDNASTNLIIRTFAALEALATALLNEGVVEGISFFPKQPDAISQDEGVACKNLDCCTTERVAPDRIALMIMLFGMPSLMMPLL